MTMKEQHNDTYVQKERQRGYYRGIIHNNILNTALQLTTKVLINRINKLSPLSDEQKGFRAGRASVDAMFKLIQVTNKAIEYNKPAYLWLSTASNWKTYCIYYRKEKY